MFNKHYWLGESGVFVRAVRTFAQTAIAIIGVSSFSVWSMDWTNVIGVSLGAALVSVLMSLDRHSEPAKVTIIEEHAVEHPTSGVTPLGLVGVAETESWPPCGGSFR